MNKKLLKILAIPLLVTAIFFVVNAFPLFTHFGISSVVEEKSLDFEGESKLDAPLLKKEKISAKFSATENNLGIILIRFVKFGRGSDTLMFRIKRERDTKWYYENKYYGELFHNNEYYPFGFPSIPSSKNKSYFVEVESTSGRAQSGVAVSKMRPQTALIYNYTISDIKNPVSLISFVYKKITYVVRNINYPILLSIFILSTMLSLLAKRINVAFKRIIKLLLKIKKNPIKFSKEIVAGVDVNIFTGRSKWKSFQFTKFKIYQYLLNTNTKRRILITVILFFIAFLFRYSSSLVNQSSIFYYTLGGGGDYDQFIRAATCSIREFCPAILHQNLLVESSILGIFYELFGFTGGIKAYLYLMLIASSLVATIPYVLLSRKNLLTLGGIIGGLFLATSDFLTSVALSFPPDNLSLFTFSMFYIVYFLTLHFGTIRWLLFFGLMGTLDGFNKALFLINDLVVFILFIPSFLIEKVKKIRKFPFIKLNSKLLIYSILPLLIFLVIYSAWEYFVYEKWTARYFLGNLIETGGSNFRFETLFYNRSSGKAEQDLILQLFYLLISGLIMIKRMVSFSDLQVIFLAPIFFGLLLFSFIKSSPKMKLSPVKLGAMFFLSLVSIALLVSVKNNYLGIHQIFPGEYIYANWTLETYVRIFLFASIFFLFILNFKYQAFKLALPIVPYVIMLIILTKNAPWERLLVHVIVWSIILFSFLTDWILDKVKMNNALKRLWIGPVILVLFISFYTIPKISDMVGKLSSGINTSRNEIQYLKWVSSSLPANAIILAGGKSDLIAVGENIDRPIVYNSLWSTSLLIRPNRIPGVSPQDFTLIGELRNKDNFNKKRYFVLESDIDLWKGRLQDVGDSVFTTDPKSNIALHAEDFSIKVYKTNQELNKNIYELGPKE